MKFLTANFILEKIGIKRKRESFLATVLRFLLRLALRSLARGKCPSVEPQKFT